MSTINSEQENLRLLDKINKLEKELDFKDVDADSRIFEAYKNPKHPDHEVAVKQLLLEDMVKENIARGEPLNAKVIEMKLKTAMDRFMKHEKNFYEVRAFRDWEDEVQFGTPKSSEEALETFRKYMAEKLKKKEWTSKTKEQIDLEVFKKRMEDLDKDLWSGEITKKM